MTTDENSSNEIISIGRPAQAYFTDVVAENVRDVCLYCCRRRGHRIRVFPKQRFYAYCILRGIFF